MKKVIGLSLVCSLIVPAFVLLHSAAWSGCTPQQRIELGKQGYDKDEVNKACADDDGEDFWGTLSKELAKGLAGSLTKELGQGVGEAESKHAPATSATHSASACVTPVGTCPLPAGPIGVLCHCGAWNGSSR